MFVRDSVARGCEDVDDLFNITVLASFFMSFILLFAVLLVGWYLFSAYYLYKICRKYSPCGFGLFLIPFYRVYIVTTCARVPGWILLGYYAPMLLFLLEGLSCARGGWPEGWPGGWALPVVFGILVWILRFCARFFLWGSVARSMGLSFGLWGFFSALVPAISVCEILLAFESSLQPGTRSLPAGSAFSEASSSYPPSSVPVASRVSEVSPALLYGRAGPFAGQSLSLPPEGLRMGREPQGNDLVLLLPKISRRHARIVPLREGWGLEDLDSTNGTFVFSAGRWSRVQAIEPLAPGSRFRLGGDEVEFEVR